MDKRRIYGECIVHLPASKAGLMNVVTCDRTGVEYRVVERTPHVVPPGRVVCYVRRKRDVDAALNKVAKGLDRDLAAGRANPS